VSWITGAHSLKVGGLYTRNMALDGFGIGVNHRGEYRFNAATGGGGNAFVNFLLGRPERVQDHITARGPLDGYSNDVAVFAQDDWKVNRDLTVFLGLRYEVVGTWHEDSNLLANFIVDDGGHHVVASQEVAAKLPPGLIALGRTLLASDVGLPETLLNADKNNFSPRVGFAWRLDESKTVLRGGFGLFHPTVAVQGIRDLLATNEFRYFTNWRGGGLRNGFSGGVPFTDPTSFGNQGIDPDLEAPDIYQYNLTVERELPGDMGVRVSYIGSTMRKLLNDRDFNTLPASTVPFTNDGNPDDLARLPFAPYGTYLDIVDNRGSGQYHSLQLEVLRRWRNGLAVNAAYTLADSDSNAPDTGNSTIGPVQFDPYDIEKDRGPDPNVVKHRLVANATWDIPVGRGRQHGADMSAWADALFGGWTVSTIVQARSGQNLTPFFSGVYYTTNPWNTGKPLDGLGTFFCCAWRPDQIGDPNSGGSREAFFNQAANAVPGPGQLGNAKKGSLKGPGTWVANFAFYKNLYAQDRFRLQFSTLLDNAFNHPQFFPTYGSGFVDLTSFLTEGDANNGTTGVLGADTIGNTEGFSPGRVIRIGIRAFF
jgi:hypothetical protein